MTMVSNEGEDTSAAPAARGTGTEAAASSRSAGLWWRIPLLAPALIVPVLLLGLIVTGSAMPRFDYFIMLGQLFDDQGSFQPIGLIDHQNDHLITIPKLVYLANLWLTDGSNVALGVFVWLVSAATAAVLAFFLWPALRGRPVVQIATAWLMSICLFPLAALHNYTAAMSGAAWLTANLLVISALGALSRRWSVTAGVLGVLATFTYGTALALWPALLLVLLIQRRFTRRDAVMVALGVAAVLFERLSLSATPGETAPMSLAPVTLVRSAATTVGALFTTSLAAAQVVGAVILVAAAAVTVVAVLRHRDRPAVVLLVGMNLFAVGAIVLFAITRTSLFGLQVAMHSRYMSFSAMIVLATSLLLLLTTRRPQWWGVPVAVVAAGMLVAAPTAVNTQVALSRMDSVYAIAARMGVGNRLILGFTERTTPLLERLGQYPFSPGYTSDCGLFGQRLGQQPQPSDALRGELTAVKPTPSGTSRIVTGWLVTDERLRCLLLVDGADRVVGAGVETVPGQSIPPGGKAWTGVAEPGGELSAVVLLDGDDTPYLLAD